MWKIEIVSVAFPTGNNIRHMFAECPLAAEIKFSVCPIVIRQL